MVLIASDNTVLTLGSCELSKCFHKYLDFCKVKMARVSDKILSLLVPQAFNPSVVTMSFKFILYAISFFVHFFNDFCSQLSQMISFFLQELVKLLWVHLWIMAPQAHGWVAHQEEWLGHLCAPVMTSPVIVSYARSTCSLTPLWVTLNFFEKTLNDR